MNPQEEGYVWTQAEMEKVIAERDQLLEERDALLKLPESKRPTRLEWAVAKQLKCGDLTVRRNNKKVCLVCELKERLYG